MDTKVWEESLAGLELGPRYYYDQVGSTNDVAEEMIVEGAPDLTVVIADEQQQGRGRQGREWFTPPGAALAVSVILSSEGGVIQTGTLSRVTGLGALSVALALRDRYALAAEIKWPNDVLVGGRKVCGVLVESSWKGSLLTTAILGIGINVKPESVPDEKQVRFPATSLEDAGGQTLNRPVVLATVLKKLVEWYPRMGSDTFLETWEELLAYRDQQVTLSREGINIFRGKIVGLEHDGSLRLRNASGEEASFHGGEIQLRPVDR